MAEWPPCGHIQMMLCPLKRTFCLEKDCIPNYKFKNVV